MRWLRFAVLCLFVAILQKSFLAHLNIKPDLLVVLLVFFAIHSSHRDSVITSFTIGFAADIIGTSMGPHIISFGLCGTLLAQLNRIIAIRKMRYQAAAIFLTGLLAGVLTYFLTHLKDQTASQNLCATLLWSSLYSAVVGPLLFLPSAWLMRIEAHRFSRRKR